MATTTPTSQSLPSCLQNSTCVITPANNISLPRIPFILTLTLVLLLTLASTLALAMLLYRRRTRRREALQAEDWGRKSRYLNRISVARKQLDDDFRRQYHGVLINDVENPELRSAEPVELAWEEKLHEVPNVEVKREKRLPALPPVPMIPENVRLKEGLGGTKGGAGRKEGGGGRKSLFFCDGVGVWLPKR